MADFSAVLSNLFLKAKTGCGLRAGMWHTGLGGFQLRLTEWSLGRLARVSMWLLLRAALLCHLSVFLGDCAEVYFPAFQASALARGATLPSVILSAGAALSVGLVAGMTLAGSSCDRPQAMVPLPSPVLHTYHTELGALCFTAVPLLGPE